MKCTAARPHAAYILARYDDVLTKTALNICHIPIFVQFSSVSSARKSWIVLNQNLPDDNWCESVSGVVAALNGFVDVPLFVVLLSWQSIEE
jgi:hypothetical protein